MMHVQTQPDVAPFMLARVSSLSPAQLDPLCLKATGTAIAHSLSFEQQAADLVSRTVDALHALVPTLGDEKFLRRVALRIKRDLHNGRCPGLTEEEAVALGARLAEADNDLLTQCLNAFKERDQALTHARTTFEAELGEAAGLLARSMADRQLQQGLALASPDFLATLGRTEGMLARPDSRLARTSLFYLVRAAMKTSPFSTLTFVGPAYFDRTSGPPAEPIRATMFSRALAQTWLMACARHPDLADALTLVPNDGLRREGEVWTLVAPIYLVLDGFFYRQERTVNASSYAHLTEIVLRTGTASYRSYLAAVGGCDPHATVVRLLGTYLLRPVAPWKPEESNPLRQLAVALEQVDTQLARQVTTLLHAVADMVAQLGESDGPTRLSLLAKIHQRSVGGLTIAGQVLPPWLETASLIYEDCVVPHALPPVGDGVREDLERLGRLMRPHIFRTNLYGRLVEHFVARFGRAGTCRDLLGFLQSFMTRPDVQAVLTSSLAADQACMGRPWTPETARSAGCSGLPPAATLFFQIAAASEAAVQRGEYLLIPNLYNPGHGGLIARFDTLLQSSRLPEELSAWLDQARPGAVRLDFPVFADWSTLQHGGLGRYPILRWPAEAPAVESRSRVALSDLKLVHDPDTDTLGLLDSGGCPVLPAYLGVTGPYMMQGLIRLFLTLMDPWVIGHRIGVARHPFDPPPPRPELVEHEPRVTDGRLVLRRASWRVPVSAFPLANRGEDGLNYLRRVAQWRASHGIPEEVYLHQERQRFSFDARSRKPMWLHFQSLHTLLSVKQVMDADLLAIQLVEALPSREQHWVAGSDGRPRAAEFLAMLRWPDPAS